MKSPDAARQFATEVVRTLRAQGFEALWAGGCVRDQLLNLTPKDYDVATSAKPEEVRRVFGFHRTLAVGAAFGVITVLGPNEAGQIEVATFRSDGAYLDGRHPANVVFSTAREDAERRDFTINGMFFDPLTYQVHDYVSGQIDLERRVIRAIGQAEDRFHEDKLRMLRAVRFAATFDFAIDPTTLAAIQKLAAEIVIVSAERIAAEMRRLLAHTRRALGVRLLRETALLNVILPEATVYDDTLEANNAADATLRWQTTLALLATDPQLDFPTALALLIRGVAHFEGSLPGHDSGEPIERARVVCRRWKLSNEETSCVCWLLEHEELVLAAREVAWPRLQRVLTSRYVDHLLHYGGAVSQVLLGHARGIEYCRDKLALPPEQLNPEPLITGDDLVRSGLRPGPRFKLILEHVRDAQLEHHIDTRSEALDLATRLNNATSP